MTNIKWQFSNYRTWPVLTITAALYFEFPPRRRVTSLDVRRLLLKDTRSKFYSRLKYSTLARRKLFIPPSVSANCVSMLMCPTKLRIFDKRSVFEIVRETSAAGWNLLDNWACLTEGFTPSSTSPSTPYKVSATAKTGLDGNNRGNKNLVAGRHITQSVFTKISVWSSLTIQDWRARTSAKIFGAGTGRTFHPSLESHAELGRKDDGRVDEFNLRTEQIFDTITSQVWKLYVTKSPAILNAREIVKLNGGTPFSDDYPR